jgi:hypothetical protein
MDHVSANVGFGTRGPALWYVRRGAVEHDLRPSANRRRHTHITRFRSRAALHGADEKEKARPKARHFVGLDHPEVIS